ncbi:MAG: maleylacetoacetate isomerase [Inquilinaceae bacterium]
MKLFTYFRSSAAYRVRIALALKGLGYDPVAVHLRRRDQRAPDYMDLHPLGLVPTLIDGADVLTQSMAIVEYLEERYPDPPLLPAGPVGRARVRALAQAIACDIHPVNNLRVLQYLTGTLKISEADRDAWYRHWIAEGFAGLEKMLKIAPQTGRFCHGNVPGLADVFLVPQIYNARRYDCDLAPYPIIRRIETECLALPEFADTAPDRQPDAE